MELLAIVVKMWLCLLMLLSAGPSGAVQGKEGDVDDWVDWDDYDDFDDQGRLWSADSDDLPIHSSSLDQDDYDDFDEEALPVPSTELPSDIPPTSDSPIPPISPSPAPPVPETIPPEVIPKEAALPPGNSTEATAAVGQVVAAQEESAVMVVLVMTAGTFLAVFAIYWLFSRKSSKKSSQVAAGSKEVSRLLKVPHHGL